MPLAGMTVNYGSLISGKTTGNVGAKTSDIEATDAMDGGMGNNAKAKIRNEPASGKVITSDDEVLHTGMAPTSGVMASGFGDTAGAVSTMGSTTSGTAAAGATGSASALGTTDDEAPTGKAMTLGMPLYGIRLAALERLAELDRAAQALQRGQGLDCASAPCIQARRLLLQRVGAESRRNNLDCSASRANSVVSKAIDTGDLLQAKPPVDQTSALGAEALGLTPAVFAGFLR